MSQLLADLIGLPLAKYEIVIIDGIETLVDRGYDLAYITLAILTILFVIGLFQVLHNFQTALSNKRIRR